MRVAETVLFGARRTLRLEINNAVGLHAGRGTCVAVRAEGDDADAAVAALRELVGSNFGEAA